MYVCIYESVVKVYTITIQDENLEAVHGQIYIGYE